MALQLIHSENAALLAQLKRINAKLRKLSARPDLSGPLGTIAEKLEAIRDEIEDCCENRNGKIEKGDKSAQEFLNDALNKSTDVSGLFAAAGLNSLEGIAGDLESSSKNRADKIREALKSFAAERGIELPGRGKLKDLVNHARQVLQEQQKKN